MKTSVLVLKFDAAVVRPTRCNELLCATLCDRHGMYDQTSIQTVEQC